MYVCVCLCTYIYTFVCVCTYIYTKIAFYALKNVIRVPERQGCAEGGWDGVLGRGGMGKEEVVSEARCRTLASDCGTSGDKA